MNTRIFGILNVTPDSFSDGGRFIDSAAAIARGRELADAGADVVDVGGESTRPGAVRVESDVELARVLPVISALASEGIRVSVDTMNSLVAQQAVRAGASIVNDVSGGLADPQMASVVADSGAEWILMHWRAHSNTMAAHATYTDVVTDVCAELSDRVEAALAAGVDRGRLVLDPGLGFAKTAEHNWELLRRLDTLFDLGFPVLVGASRKSFLGTLLTEDGMSRSVTERDAATLAVSVHVALAGGWAVRVHDVRATADAFAVLRHLHPES